jgi:hypothetical protein
LSTRLILYGRKRQVVWSILCRRVRLDPCTIVRVLAKERLEQAVVLLVQHGPAGSVGLLLSEPTRLLLGRRLRGGLRFNVAVTRACMTRMEHGRAHQGRGQGGVVQAVQIVM